MKSLKIVLSIVGLMLFSAISFSQKKVIETSLKVDGVCFMCKERIENALDTVGVKYANWDQETHLLQIAYRADKYSEEDICQIIANAGHDTEKIKATDEAYNKIDPCCKYRDEEVVKSHGDH